MSKETEEKIQGWVDKRFGLPNRFNTQLLVDFWDWARKELDEERRRTIGLVPTWLQEFEREAGCEKT